MANLQRAASFQQAIDETWSSIGAKLNCDKEHFEKRCDSILSGILEGRSLSSLERAIDQDPGDFAGREFNHWNNPRANHFAWVTVDMYTEVFTIDGNLNVEGRDQTKDIPKPEKSKKEKKRDKAKEESKLKLSFGDELGEDSY